MAEYYDGTRLLSTKDLNGKTPEIFICTGNRSAGKTTYFGRLCVNRFRTKKEKFALVYRYAYEIDDVADKFFKDIQTLFFRDMEMTAKKRARGVFQELFLNKESCGYAIPLNAAEQIKKYSHFFSDVDRMIFDEFQSETNHYCPDEVRKFISVHTSVARGNGKHARYVPVYMLGNTVSILNPYFVAMNVSDRLKDDTKILRGDGFVLEQAYVETASRAQKESGFNRAFADSDYISYSAENVYLNDNKAFVEKPEGRSGYICTLKCDRKNYAIREYPEYGILYCDDRPDMSYGTRISVTTDDHDVNYVMLKKNEFLLSNMRYLFERGCFRFKNLECKAVVLKALSY